MPSTTEPGSGSPRSDDVLARSLELRFRDDLPRFPNLVDLHGYWNGKRRDGRLPARRDIDPLEIPRSLGLLLLVDMLRDPLDFRYRLVGTGVCNPQESDFTNRSPRDLDPAALGALIWDDYAEVVRRREPAAHMVIVEGLHRVRYYARLILPLARDGETVDMLLVGDSSEQNTMSLRNIFGTLEMRRRA